MRLVFRNQVRPPVAIRDLRRAGRLLVKIARLLAQDPRAPLTSRQRVQMFELGRRELGVAFVSPREIQMWNRRYRRRNKATDVLSFDGDGNGSLGDLMLCPRVLKHQAQRFSTTTKEETLYIFVHGVLHLLGFEHERGHREAQIMLDIQDTLYAKLSSDLAKG